MSLIVTHSVTVGRDISNLLTQVTILGNILIWALTNAKNSTRYELAIDLEDWSGNRRFARYRSFRLGPEKDGFRLHHQVQSACARSDPINDIARPLDGV